jgi:hypothetical protein
MRPGIGRIRPQLAQDAGLSFSVKVDARAALEWPITRPASNLIYEFAVRGSPTLLSKHSLPCCFPARSSRETPVQAIEMLSVLARLRLAPPCIFRKSPCIFPNCRERQVGLRLHPQPRSLVSVGHVWVAELCATAARQRIGDARQRCHPQSSAANLLSHISLGPGLCPVGDSASSGPPSWGSVGMPSSFGCRG